MDLINISRVAKILDKPESTCRKLADAGRLPVAATLEDGTRLFERVAIENAAASLTPIGGHAEIQPRVAGAARV